MHQAKVIAEIPWCKKHFHAATFSWFLVPLLDQSADFVKTDGGIKSIVSLTILSSSGSSMAQSVGIQQLLAGWFRSQVTVGTISQTRLKIFKSWSHLCFLCVNNRQFFLPSLRTSCGSWAHPHHLEQKSVSFFFLFRCHLGTSVLRQSPGLHHWLPSQSFAPRTSSTTTRGPLQQHQAPNPPAATTHLERRQRDQNGEGFATVFGEKTVNKNLKRPECVLSPLLHCFSPSFRQRSRRNWNATRTLQDLRRQRWACAPRWHSATCHNRPRRNQKRDWLAVDVYWSLWNLINHAK